MPNAQGILKTIAYKKQSGQGTAASGSGGQLLRRRTCNFNLTRDTYENDEIVSHRQSTGATAGIRRVAGKYSGLLSPLTFQAMFEAILMKAAAATTSITGISATIATSGSNWTVTRAAGDFLTGGIKVGDVVRLSVGSLNAANINKNLLVLAVTATVLTVRPLNGVALVAEGPIATVTVSVPGKKIWVPTSGHTDDWYTFEEYFADLTRSEVTSDVKLGQMQIGIPATGNATVDIDFVGLDRTRSGAQVLTSPTAETSTSVAQAVSGLVVVNSVVTPITSGQITINPNTNPGEAEVGSNAVGSMALGRVQVTGQFTAKFSGVTLQDLFDNQTSVALLIACPVDATAASEFVAFTMSKVKLFSDSADDGEKEIIRTYSFTAEINGSGGAALASHQTIISIQDSQAA